jgi:hypothetical protein
MAEFCPNQSEIAQFYAKIRSIFERNPTVPVSPEILPKSVEKRITVHYMVACATVISNGHLQMKSTVYNESSDEHKKGFSVK